MAFHSPGGSDQTPWEAATFTKADVTAAGSSGAWTTANSPITLFTVTGLVMARMFGVVSTGLTSTGSNGTVAVGVTGSTSILMNTMIVNGTILGTAGFVWGNSGSAYAVNLQTNASTFIPVNGNIILTININNMTAGGMTIYCQWIALSAGATVVAATP